MPRQPQRDEVPPLEVSPDQNVFIMMPYRKTAQFRKVELIITEALRESGLYARFAKDSQQDQLLWQNVRAYMDACRYGIAVFDNLKRDEDEQRLNPNVCTELGYMIARGKPNLILRDQNVQLHKDFHGFNAEEFDGQDLETLRTAVVRWAEQQATVIPLFQSFARLLPGSKIARRVGEESQAKLAIGNYLANAYLLKEFQVKSLILDSGTSAAAVAEALFLNREKYGHLDVYTNNLLASVLLCSTERFHCNIVPGKVDDDYAGVFGAEACAAIKKCKADVTILACTSFTAEKGPFAESPENRSFKRALLTGSKATIILAPPERLGEEKGEPVWKDAKQWQQVLDKNIHMVLTTHPTDLARLNGMKQKLGRKLEVVEY